MLIDTNNYIQETGRTKVKCVMNIAKDIKSTLQLEVGISS
jgi:hypothetical protein